MRLSCPLLTSDLNAVNEYTSIVDGGVTFPQYDCNGNLRRNGTYIFEYDFENRLIEVLSGASVSGLCNLTTTGGSVVATYAYDSRGRRTQKVTSSSTVNYYFDAARVIEERDGFDAVVATYVWGSWIDEILTMDKGGSTYYYHQNSLGSVTAVTDSSGVVVERYEYDAYGNVSVFDGSYTPLLGSAIGNPYTFTGREYDTETGFYYYRARYYDPVWGRFLQRDASGYVDGVNLYEYVKNNPVKFVDPDGRLAITIIVAIIGVCGAVVTTAIMTLSNTCVWGAVNTVLSHYRCWKRSEDCPKRKCWQLKECSILSKCTDGGWGFLTANYWVITTNFCTWLDGSQCP